MSRSMSVAALGALLVLFASLAGTAQGASFDCKRAGTRVEHLVCADPELDVLDNQLQGAYLGALDRSLHPETVKNRQISWLKSRETCADAKCLNSLYRRQIDMLLAVADPPDVCRGSTTPELDTCAAEYARRAEAELARYMGAARKRLNNEIAEQSDAKASQAALAGLGTSQKAWEAYAKAECDAVYNWWREGTIRGLMYQTCVQDLTKERTLWIWSTWLSFEDSSPALLPKPRSKEGPTS